MKPPRWVRLFSDCRVSITLMAVGGICTFARLMAIKAGGGKSLMVTAFVGLAAITLVLLLHHLARFKIAAKENTES